MWSSPEMLTRGSSQSHDNMTIPGASIPEAGRACVFCVGGGDDIPGIPCNPSEDSKQLFNPAHEKSASQLQDPYRKIRRVLPIVDAHAGNRHPFWHLSDGEERVHPVQCSTHGNPDDRLIGL